MRRTPRAHYVRHNAVTRVPRAFVYLDTEAYKSRDGKTELQSFRLAVAAFDARRHDTNGWKERDWHRSTDTHDLWEWITSRCRKKARTVLVAHNLAYDLRLSDAFVVLPELGWRCIFVRLDGGQAMAIWRLDNRTLAMVDTYSWTPTALERLGNMIDLPKLDLPDEDDSDDARWARCTRDVEILAEVWLRLMRWIETDDLGNWKPTGAGQSWAAFRHRFKHHDLLVHEDDDARDAERTSTMTGRCEAWRHGELSGGPFVEWDFTAAYCNIGAQCAVPVKLSGELWRPSLMKVLNLDPSRAVLMECTITTDRPTVPFRDEDGIRWPVGTITTTGWAHELLGLAELGREVVVHRAWVYRCEPALQQFCEWVLAGMDPTTGHPDPIVRAALKHWSRTLIGRTAAQWSRWDVIGSSPEAGVSLGRAHDVGAGETFRLLQVGHDLLRARPYKENPDAMVSIMSWIMAEARCRLWRVMEAAGLDHVVYCDTDSVIVDAAGDLALQKAAVDGLRVKNVYQSLEVLAPRQIVPQGRLRASGVPTGARKVSEHVWEGEVWTGLGASIASGEPDTVRVALRRFRLSGTDRRRDHLPDGSTAAVRVELGAANGALTA